MKTRTNTSGFGLLPILLVSAVVVILVVAGTFVYRSNHESGTKNSTASNSQTDTNLTGASTTQSTTAPAQTYLSIKEWGIQIPLSDAIKDAYYAPARGSSKGSDSQPNQLSLSLKSLDSSGCSIANNAAPVLLFRVPPDEVDPVSGKTISQAGPGTTIGNYFYGYSLTKSTACSADSTFQMLDSAMASAVKGVARSAN